jgi:hypothetical protein
MKKKVAEAGADLYMNPIPMEFDDRDALIKHLMAAPDEERDSAADRGTAVHDLAEKGVSSTDPGVDPTLAPWLAQYEEAIGAEGITPILRERQVISESLGYAGSFDLIGMRQGKVTMLDIKTSKGTYVDHALQLYGYALADYIGQDDVVDEDATKVLQSVEAMGIIHVRDTGWKYIEVPVSGITRAAWEHMVGLARFYLQYPDLTSLPK